MNRKIALALIIIVIVSSVSIIGYMPKALGQSGTSVSSQIITSNTTWTQAGSPYTFTGPVGVAADVALTIDAGVTVNLESFGLNVNGTLYAQGTPNDKITFNSLYAISLASSYLYNPSSINAPSNINIANANAACTIENAVLTNTSLNSAINTSVKINNCYFDGGAGLTIWSSSTTLSNSYVTGQVFVRGPAVVSKNILLGGVDAGLSTIVTPESYNDYSCVFSDNNITNPGGTAVAINGAATISDNIISDGSTGISLSSEGATIQGNLIVNNGMGISIDPSHGGGVIDNNTIANNSGGGIGPATESDTINFNNLENNGQFNLESATNEPVGGGGYGSVETYPFPVNATYNWWGTSDSQAISQTIKDTQSDYQLGAVTFEPFLTAPNPEAPSITTTLTTPTLSSTPSPTPKSTLTSPNPTATQQNPTTGAQTKTEAGFNWPQIALLIAVAVIVASVVVVVALLHGHRKTANLIK